MRGSYKAIDILYEKLSEISGITDLHRVACDTSDVSHPPEGWRPNYRKKRYWCPYCGEERRFIEMKNNGFLNCEVCWISSAEYYVKQCNNLDVIMSTEDKARKKAHRQTKVERRERIKKLKD